MLEVRFCISKQGRFAASCARIINDYEKLTFSTVIVGGYIGDNIALSSVEVLDDNDSSWKPGPSLPLELAAMALVTDPFGSVFLIGGHDKTSALSALVLRLRNSKARQWEVFPYTLKTKRGWPFAISVPDWIFDCT